MSDGDKKGKAPQNNKDEDGKGKPPLQTKISGNALTFEDIGRQEASSQIRIFTPRAKPRPEARTRQHEQG
jgi:hypothetical protein